MFIIKIYATAEEQETYIGPFPTEANAIRWLIADPKETDFRIIELVWPWSD